MILLVKRFSAMPHDGYRTGVNHPYFRMNPFEQSAYRKAMKDAIKDTLKKPALPSTKHSVLGILKKTE